MSASPVNLREKSEERPASTELRLGFDARAFLDMEYYYQDMNGAQKGPVDFEGLKAVWTRSEIDGQLSTSSNRKDEVGRPRLAAYFDEVAHVVPECAAAAAAPAAAAAAAARLLRGRACPAGGADIRGPAPRAFRL